MLLTDPPYATTKLEWDQPVNWPLFWTDALRICKPKSPIVMFASGKFVNQLINTNPGHFRYELIWEKTIPVGFLDANRRPLRAHENILHFAQKFAGSQYNPQMVAGPVHTRGGKAGKRPRHYGGHNKIVDKMQTDLYHPRSVLKFARDPKSLHPTQKPLELMRWLVRTYSNRFDTILEPFAGSGSTLLAAALEGRRAIGIEKDRAFCDTIRRRLESDDRQ
ncbi:MAG: site-specific DNA-methyltransferase [Acidobacteria bacterium]|nr:site-specific DNA-methyltransferase [Acidobacteriota bacterium]